MSTHYGIDVMRDDKFRAGYEFARRELDDEPQAIREATAREFTKQLNRIPIASEQARVIQGALAFLTDRHEGNQS